MSQVEIQKSTILISSKLLKLTILIPLDWVSKIKSPWDEHICREFVEITSYQTVFWLQIWKKICKEWTCPLILDQLSFHQIPNDGNSDNRLAKGFCIPVVIVMELAYSPDCFVDRLLLLGLRFRLSCNGSCFRLWWLSSKNNLALPRLSGLIHSFNTKYSRTFVCLPSSFKTELKEIQIMPFATNGTEFGEYDHLLEHNTRGTAAIIRNHKVSSSKY